MRALTLVLWLALALPQVAAADAPAVLFESAKMWEAQGRPDLARLALEKLLAASPGDPAASLMLGELEIRSGRIEVAERLLEELRKRHPQDPRTAELADTLRLQTRDRLPLATMRRLVQMGRHDEAAEAARKLFPQGAPPGALGIEYWSVLSRAEGGVPAARAGLEELSRRYPQDARYRIALGRLLVQNEQTRRQGLRLLADLAMAGGAHAAEALAAWRSGLDYLGDDISNLPLLQQYLKQRPDDEGIAGSVKNLRARQRQNDLRRRDPFYKALAAAEEARDAGRLEEAQARLDDARRLRPQSAELLGAEGQLRMRESRHAEAAKLFEQAVRSDRGRWQRDLQRARMWMELDQARSLRDAGELEAALARSNAALALGKNDSDALALKASILALQPGQAAAAEQIYRELLQRRPLPRAAWSGLVDLLKAQNRNEEAAVLVTQLQQQVPPRELAGLRAEALYAGSQTERSAGRTGAALRMLEEAQQLVPDDPWMRYRLARLYAELDLPAEAQALMAEGVKRTPQSADLRYAQALMLASVDDHEGALGALEAIAPAERSDAMRTLERRLRVSQATAAARSDPARAGDLLGQAEALAGADADLRADIADAWLALGESRRALALYPGDEAAGARWAGLQQRAGDLQGAERTLRRLLATQPADAGLHLALAEVLMQRGGQREAALAEIDAALASASSLQARSDAVQLLLDAGETRRAMELGEQLQAEAPEAAATQLAAARLSRAQHRYNAAMAQYQAALAAERREGRSGYSPAQAGIDSLERRRDGWIAAAPGYYDKSGDDGISAYRASQVVIEARLPYRYEGHFFAVADTVSASAGQLPADYDDAALFGTVQAAGPVTYAATGSGGEQQAQGTDLGLGWQGERLRVDVGSTPLGFPVENLVGGLRWSDDLGPWSYTLNLARRPVTGSLLSYAGVRDPVSGEIWGGVVASGADARAAHRQGRLDLSASASLQRLSGRRVLDNDRSTLRLAADWALVESERQRLEVGFALNAWRYAENLGEYTFGHGGYYSPQRYLSAVLPLVWEGRWQSLVWELRGSVSVSRTETDAQDFYPNDPALQAQALGMPLPSGFSAPAYEGGRGGGSGYSLRGSAEYPLGRHWILGGSFDLDRSEFYTPNQFSAWLRYDFDGRPAPLDFPPRPPRAYSGY